MRKYMLKRILFSIFSLLVVLVVVMLLIFTLTDRRVILQTDETWLKRSGNERTMYEYTMFQKYGYLQFANYADFAAKKYKEIYGEEYSKQDAFNADIKAIQKTDSYTSNATVQEFIAEYEAKGWDITYLEPLTFRGGKLKPGGKAFLLAVNERNVLLRLADYLGGLISVETTKDVKDETLTDRYIRFEKDPYGGGFCVVGSGTQHKYLLYFDSRFPFIHQNFIHLNLGTSYTAYRGQEITTVISSPTGELRTRKTQYPAQLGTDIYIESAIDFHTLTYNMGTVSDIEKTQFPDNYTVYKFRRTGLSMLENSFVIGLISTILAYMLGLPIGVLMAMRKDKLGDHIGNMYIIFIIAVPMLAYIFMFAALGVSLFKLPYKFATASVPILAYILPTISLTLPSVGSLMKWMRRYMIDQMNSDYVKFARAEGLSEREIFSKHIARNALIYIVQGIPGSILFCLVGAIVTERVYDVPGVGNLLTNAINQHDNGIIVATTAFYTLLTILSIILGDLLLAKYDPRISLSSDKGGGR